MLDIEVLFDKEHSDESPGIRIYYNTNYRFYSTLTSMTIPHSMVVKYIGYEISKIIEIQDIRLSDWSNSIVKEIKENSDKLAAYLHKLNYPGTITCILSR